ncbi:MAG: DNA-binding transcriptional activator DecR [Formosa sp. Hel1_33_131]|nr:MAG: DNA-binding transcriptional activator DecR [Formosa sp. Hel1_33_131]|tara:strand:+ start:654 stop:1130 length:477 start_codon:yes stop_codon:yes gene_type:complete
MLDKLNTTDIKILRLLQENSNRTIKNIADILGMTTTPVFERIKKLEKNGFIKKYAAILDSKKLGLKLTVFVGITIKRHTRSYLEKFVTTIQGFPEVVECHRVSGNFDYLLKLVVIDIEDYEQFILTKLAIIADLSNVQSYVALSQSKSTNEVNLNHLM